MIFYDANVASPNPAAVRLFILERGHLELDVQVVDIINLENRSKDYRHNVNARGELPALKLDNGLILTEFPVICGYLDEVATGGRSLFGATPEERAVTSMWARRVYLEIVAPFVAHWRGGEAAIDFYKGNRLPMPEAQLHNRLDAENGLNRLDDDLDGKAYIAGDDISMADLTLFSFMAIMGAPILPWLNVPIRKNVAAWFDRMAARPAGAQFLNPLPSRVTR